MTKYSVQILKNILIDILKSNDVSIDDNYSPILDYVAHLANFQCDANNFHMISWKETCMVYLESFMGEEISEKVTKKFVEESEKPMINFLEKELGMDVIPMPFRQVFEFGGSLHCSTWDVRRNGQCKDFFPNREDIEDVGLTNLTDLP